MKGYVRITISVRGSIGSGGGSGGITCGKDEKIIDGDSGGDT